MESVIRSFIKKQSTKKIVLWICIAIGAFLGAVLLYSVLMSGYHYLFDLDEMNHIQRAYFILKGNIPFVSFYSIYTPVFQWFMLPILMIFGFSFSSFYAMRAVMVILFLCRLIMLFLLCKKIFGRNVAFLSIFLYLLDPITVFTSMQIRPDNLMLFLYFAGLLVFAHSKKKQTKKFMIATGSLFSLSLVVHIKTLPSVFAVSVLFLLYQVMKKDVRQVLSFVLGALIPVVIFVFYTLVTGSFEAMVQQVVFDPARALGELMYPAEYGRFFRPGNYNLFGTSVFKPLNWLYVWILPWLGFAGACVALIRTLEHMKNKTQSSWISFMTIALVFAMLMQWLWLFTVDSVFIQYYLPVTWMFAVFGAYALYVLLSEVKPYKQAYQIMIVIGLLIFIAFVRQGIQANFTRADIQDPDTIEQIEKLWEIIPEDAAVYPRLVFRPSGHPLGTAQFYPELPKEIQNRYVSLENWLETYQVPYVLLSYYEIGVYGEEFASYLRDHYEKVVNMESLYKRR